MPVSSGAASSNWSPERRAERGGAAVTDLVLGPRAAPPRVAIALEIVGLSERGRHRPRELSGGEQQRVGIARALVNDPMLLVCDEPTGDLDRTTSGDILELLVALNRDHGKTILMVTHDPVAGERASRTLHLEDAGPPSAGMTGRS